jgi:hypothetical protein
MSEAATVFWIPVATMVAPATPHAPIFSRGKDRKFGSLETAIRFVMEELPESDRPTAMIQTDNASIQFEDLERMYAGLKKALPASSVTGGDNISLSNPSWS